MEFLKCRDVRWKGAEKRNKRDVAATTAKHPDSRSQISRYGWMQPMYMRSVSFLGKFTSGSRISASRCDLLKLPIAFAMLPLPPHPPARGGTGKGKLGGGVQPASQIPYLIYDLTKNSKSYTLFMTKMAKISLNWYPIYG